MAEIALENIPGITVDYADPIYSNEFPTPRQVAAQSAVGDVNPPATITLTLSLGTAPVNSPTVPPTLRGRVQIPPKFSSDTIAISAFDFSGQLANGETISSVTVTVLLMTGIDPTPGNILFGNAVISGPIVSQLVTGGVEGSIYVIRVQATTTLGQKPTMSGYMAIIPTI